MYLGEFVSDLNWRLRVIKARLLLSRSKTSLAARKLTRFPRGELESAGD